jgi:hypothetical protein
VGAVAAVLLWGVVARTPFYDLIRLLFLTGLAALGVSDWRAQGHRWLPTLSWTVPFGLWMVAVQWLVDPSSILGPLGYSIGIAFLVVMMASSRAALWWYEVVLRRPYKT